MKGRCWIPLLALAWIVGLSGCSKSPSGPAFGTMSVKMTDAPADYEAVNLLVVQVAAHRAGDDSTSGWEVLESDTVTYDLLSLQNGVFATLATSQVPAGHYTQLRLKLAPGCNVVIGGVPHPLTVPSGLQSGLKLIGSIDVPANGRMDLALDFDAARSIEETGSGSFILNPTVRMLPSSAAGAIRGIVAPAGMPTMVYALQAADTLGTAMTAPDGSFALSVLPAGTYDLALHPAVEFPDSRVSGIVVVAGTTTDVGVLQLGAP